MSEVSGVVHAADLEGVRLCGATTGLKTVMWSTVLARFGCPECRAEVEARAK